MFRVLVYSSSVTITTNFNFVKTSCNIYLSSSLPKLWYIIENVLILYNNTPNDFNNFDNEF